jgi:hypothetical protein
MSCIINIEHPSDTACRWLLASGCWPLALATGIRHLATGNWLMASI